MDKQSVGVAIQAQLTDLKDMAAGLAFFPEFVARAAEEDDLAGFPGQPVSLGIHKAEHEDLTGSMILDYGGEKAATLVKSEFHGNSFRKQDSKNKKPAGAQSASGPKSALFSELLSTPQRARLVAVMMVMPIVRRGKHNS
jgi:hypothetical protein